MLLIDKIKLTLLTIITFGFIWIWINKKQIKNQELSVKDKINISIKQLKQNLGSSNILSIENTHQKVKITFADKTLVNQEAISKMKGISGVFATSNSITIIVGKSARVIKEQLKK